MMTQTKEPLRVEKNPSVIHGAELRTNLRRREAATYHARPTVSRTRTIPQTAIAAFFEKHARRSVIRAAATFQAKPALSRIIQQTSGARA